MNNIGYCCINLSINEGLKKKDYISVNRGMIKKTFDARGLDYVSELAILNLQDTLKILDWNIKHGILVYRLSSDSFPWFSHYKFSDLPNYNKIERLLKRIGEKVMSNNLRTSLHPGPFNLLASERDDVVIKTIDELDKHSQILDLMGLEQSTFYPVNIHIGTTKPGREEACQKFCQNFELLSDSCKKRLTVENDDSPNQYSVKMLYDWVHTKINIPIVFDSFHHKLNSGGYSEKDALNLAISTWKTKPLCHHSSSRKEFEDISAKSEAHSDFLYEKFNDYDNSLDIEMECKMKDIALKKYISDFMK
jgi:UV DNA damage endonuclease